MDPCEKEPTDVLDNMVPQDREEITVNAQVTAAFFGLSVRQTLNNQVRGRGVCSTRILNNRKREQAHLLSESFYFSKNVSSCTKSLFSSSVCSKLCGCSPSDRYTRFWTWSLCLRPRPALATANGGWTAATRAKERGRERKTKRRKLTALDRRFGPFVQETGRMSQWKN